MDIVLKDLLPAAKICAKDDSHYQKYAWADWNNTLIEECKLTNGITVEFDTAYVPIGEELLPLNKVIVEGDGAKNYNDVLYSSCYKPIYTFKYIHYIWDDDHGGRPMTYSNTTLFNIGGFTYCLWCGEEECLTGADTMMCEQCELEHGHSENELFTICDSCGRRIYTDDSYAVGDESWCQHCFDKYARKCECCGEVMYEEQIHYHEGTQQYVCEYCLEELNEEKENFIYG
jgi:hypothetical protein